MRIVLLANNWVGWKIAEYLRAEGEDIAALVLHPLGRRKFGEHIIRAAGVRAESIFDGSLLHRPDTLAAIQQLVPDIGISVMFGYILRPHFLDLFSRGVINLHPGLLPYNRGAYPNVWSIIEGTPAGVTIHYVDAGVDTGDIIAQRSVEVEPVDTGETLYHKLERASLELFMESWPLIRSGNAPRVPQREEEGTFHRRKDVESIDEIVMDRPYKAKELINIIRARTFPPYPGAYFVHQGRKVYLRLQLLYEEEVDQ